MADPQVQFEWLFYMRERPLVVLNGFPVDEPLDHPFLKDIGNKYGAICAMRPGSCASELSLVVARKYDALKAWSKLFEVPYDSQKPESTVRAYMGRRVKHLPSNEQFSVELDSTRRFFYQPQANIHGTIFLPRGYLEGDPEHQQAWSLANPLARPPPSGQSRPRPPQPVTTLPMGHPPPPPIPQLSSLPAQLSSTHLTENPHPVASTSSGSGRRVPLPPQSELAPRSSARSTFDTSGFPARSHPHAPLPPQSELAPRSSARSNQDPSDLPARSQDYRAPPQASALYDDYENSNVDGALRDQLNSVPIRRRDDVNWNAGDGLGDLRQVIYKLRDEFYWNDDNYVRDRVAVYWREVIEQIVEIAIFNHPSSNNHWTLRVTFSHPGARQQISDNVLCKRAGGQRDSTYRRG
ncbi:uncharacterized protein JCM6883_004459 [Sporobolomyces salmoneus]|uniref:uncharacterized protein n=1 Tax=Sporobolomyces salmoneus TaxID=183962 RepID=UPI00316D494C